DVLGEWDFSNVTIDGQLYNNVHVSILDNPHEEGSAYHYGVDISYGDCFIYSDGDFADNVYTGKYYYQISTPKGKGTSRDEDGWNFIYDITATFSFVNDKLQIKIEAQDPIGSFTIQGGTKTSTPPNLTSPEKFSDIEGTWQFTNVLIQNQPQEVGGDSFLSTCTLKIAKETTLEGGINQTLKLNGIDQNTYDCDYFGQIISDEGGGLYQWSYFYSITDINKDVIAQSTTTQTITAKFSLGDGKLFVEFDGDGPLDGVQLNNGVKQTEEG
ncbi:MAG TPA: hypothetical protein PLA21_07725, partial [Rectinema sp.]|nr:hypothetical protein [Rectinema sp.]